MRRLGRVTAGSALLGISLALAAGPALAQSPGPSTAPGSVLPSTLLPPGAGPAYAIAWTGDLDTQPGRGQVPFRLFTSGSQLDETARLLGIDLSKAVGDRGLVRGADPSFVYEINAVVDPAIDGEAWTDAWIDPRSSRGWDRLETAAGPVIFSMTGGLRFATDGLAVEVVAPRADEAELLGFFGQLPPNGIDPVTDPVALERGRQLGDWAPPTELLWAGNVARRAGPIMPRPMDDLTDGIRDARLAVGLCVDPGTVLGFSAGTRLGGPTLSVLEWLDPTGDAARWIAPIRRAIAETTGFDGKPPKRLKERPVKDRPSVQFRSRRGDRAFAVVASGPAVTVFMGDPATVRRALATYPFADPLPPGTSPAASPAPAPSCPPAG